MNPKSLFHVTLGVAFALSSTAAQAQGLPGQQKRSSSVPGSPLDTILSTRLWTDVPPAQNFVKETRPDVKSLDYAPLTGTDPQRPKPRNADGVAALQAELEADGARNERKARGGRGAAAAAPAKGTKRAKTTKSIE